MAIVHSGDPDLPAYSGIFAAFSLIFPHPPDHHHRWPGPRRVLGSAQYELHSLFVLLTEVNEKQISNPGTIQMDYLVVIFY